MPQLCSALHAALTFSPPYKSSACSARVRSCNAPPSSGLAVCAQPRPPPNVRAAQPMVPYTTLPHPPYYPLNGGAGREKFWGRAAAAAGRWRKKKKRTRMMTGRTGRRNLGAASELHWPTPSSPHFSSFFPHQSDTGLHHPSLTLSLGLYGKCIYTGWKSARIVGTDNYAD